MTKITSSCSPTYPHPRHCFNSLISALHVTFLPEEHRLQFVCLFVFLSKNEMRRWGHAF